MMFTCVPQPLIYAEQMLQLFARLAQAVDEAALSADVVRAVADLTGCELSQLYLLDATHTCLGLHAQYLQGELALREAAAVSVDYNGEQLLQFALCQNRVVSLADLRGGLYDSGFLPESEQPWRSLLCVPLLSQNQAVRGLLLCARREYGDLQGFAASLGFLGGSALVQLQLRQRLRRPQATLSAPASAMAPAAGYGLIGKSAAITRTSQLISKVLHSPYTVLLQGETGTGKEVVARAIHDYGPRRSHALVVQNCASLPENLLESELFGYRKGAFTGADRDRVGLFEAADHGTLLLDEIGDMPLSLQAKLLRVLQEGEIRPLGSNDTRKVDVRIIAATHRDLRALVSEGLFREDLYYRLAQFPIELPPLRQRDGDIPLLARHFAAKTCEFLQRESLLWSEAALAQLAGYAFAGNVRELKGLVERAVLLCEGEELLAEHFLLGEQLTPESGGLSLRLRMEQLERGLLLDCLRKNAGNRTHTARELGVSRRTLHYRLDRLNIQVAQGQEGI